MSEYYVTTDDEDSEIEKLKEVFGYEETDLQDKPTQPTQQPTFKDLFGYSESEDDKDEEETDNTLDQMNLDTEDDFTMVFKKLNLK